MPLVPCHFDLPISSYGLWLKVPFCWLLKMTYNVEIDKFLWENFLYLGCEDELYEMSSPSRWGLDGIFMMNHEKVMPWSSYSWLFSCPKMETFASWWFLSHSCGINDQYLIKWWLWLQNKMLTKNFDFWLSNDHFAPAVDCEAIRVFDCATWPCEPWNLICRCLTMYMSIWDLIEPLKTSTSL